ncbi:MAG: radical SAM protein [Nanoarchaeota archaeon]
MRVVLIIPSSVGEFFSAQFPHTGMAYVSAVLKQNNIETKIIDMRLGYTEEETFTIIDEFEPQIVGITLYSLGFTKSCETINKIKLHDSSYKVVIGGPHLAALKESSLRDTLADFGIYGEGEYTMLELCQGKLPQDILGLIWRDDDKIIVNPQRPFNNDLDSLPLPDYESFELKRYLGYPERHLPIVTSRGCPYQCVFCSIRLSMGYKFRARSPENVVNELVHWYSKGWRSFEFDDDNFTLDIDRAMKICDLIISHELKITWKCDNGVRADRLSRELLEKMKHAGCVYISFGVEGGNNKMLQAMKKNEKIETIIDSIKLAKEVGLNIGATFIIGTPEETYDDFLDSLEVAKRLPVDHVSFYNMVPYPGTDMYRWIEQNGKFLVDKETYLYNIAGWKNKPIFETKNFTKEEREKAYKVAHSLYRRKALTMKLGKELGLLAWGLTGNEKVELFMKKLVLTPGPGRFIFNKIKRDPSKHRK